MNIAIRFAAFLASSALASGAWSATFFVAPDGNDAWTGRLAVANADRSEGPVASPAKAVDLARKAGSGQSHTIAFTNGSYYLDKPIALDARDSGITLEAAAGARVKLYGGRRVQGWTRDDPRLWSAPLPEVALGKWDFRVFVVDDQFRSRARLPASGYFTHTNTWTAPWLSTTAGGWGRKPSPEELTKLRYKSADVPADMDIRNAELLILHSWDASVAAIAENDKATSTLTLRAPAGNPPGAFGANKYVIWNLKDGLTKPGQWRLDRSAGRIVYWPVEGEDLAKVQAIAPTLESLIVMTGTPEQPIRNVSLRGLELSTVNNAVITGGFGASKDGAAISIRNASDILVERITVANVGGYGVKAVNVENLGVRHSTIHHTGAGGILIEGRRSSVESTLIHDVGLLDPGGIALWAKGEASSDLSLLDNVLHDTSYTAIAANGTDTQIERNRITRAVNVLSDGAAVYLSNTTAAVVRHNIVSDMQDTDLTRFAYYFDEQSRNCLLEYNVSLRSPLALQTHMAQGIVARNNLFLNSGKLLLRFLKSKDSSFSQNISVADEELRIEGLEALGTMSQNVLFSRASRYGFTGATAPGGGQSQASIDTRSNSFTDPKLTLQDERRLRFDADSSAATLGIFPFTAGRADGSTIRQVAPAPASGSAAPRSTPASSPAH